MSMSRDQLLEAALHLTDGDRLELAGQLLATVTTEPLSELDDEAEFLQELDRRANDGSPRIPWKQVRAELLDS